MKRLLKHELQASERSTCLIQKRQNSLTRRDIVHKVVLQEQLAAFKSHLLRLRLHCVYFRFGKEIGPTPAEVHATLPLPSGGAELDSKPHKVTMIKEPGRYHDPILFS